MRSVFDGRRSGTKDGAVIRPAAPEAIPRRLEKNTECGTIIRWTVMGRDRDHVKPCEPGNAGFDPVHDDHKAVIGG